MKDEKFSSKDLIILYMTQKDSLIHDFQFVSQIQVHHCDKS